MRESFCLNNMNKLNPIFLQLASTFCFLCFLLHIFFNFLSASCSASLSAETCLLIQESLLRRQSVTSGKVLDSQWQGKAIFCLKSKIYTIMSHHYTVQDDMFEICLNNHKDFLPSSLKSLLNSPSFLTVFHSFEDVMVKVIYKL